MKKCLVGIWYASCVVIGWSLPLAIFKAVDPAIPRVTGICFDDKGNTLSDVTIVAHDGNSNRFAETKSSADGKFTLHPKAIPAGPVHLSYHRENGVQTGTIIVMWKEDMRIFPVVPR